MKRSELLGVLLVAIWVNGCAKRDDTMAADSALNKDIQLAGQDSSAGGYHEIVTATGQDTAPLPALTKKPVFRNANPQMRVHLPQPAAVVSDTVHIAGGDSGAATGPGERDTIGFRSSPLAPTLTRADSVAIEAQIKALRAASISFFAPDTLFISKPELVRVIIDPESAPRVETVRPRIHPATTRVSSRTEVCLSASGLKVDDEEGADRHCRVQVIPFTAPSQWHWNVTALPEIKTSGLRPIVVTVNAVLDSFPKYTVYTTYHTAYVHVDGPGILIQTQEILSTWQALLGAIVAIGGSIAIIWKWWKPRQDKA